MIASTNILSDGLARKRLKFKARFLVEYAKSLQRNPTRLAHVVLVGTHHKTGTVWIHGIFRRLALLCGYPYYPQPFNTSIPEVGSIVADTHSHFDETMWHDTPYRGLHLIRDPRDIIVSGCFYHQKSDEAWLHVKDPEFGGLTYQEKLNSIPALGDKLLFEMDNSARRTITDIAQWDYQNSAFFEAKYEDLIRDHDLLLFHQIFAFLGFEGKTIPKALDVAWQNSLFSNRVPTSVHVRSGKPSQWKRYFEPVHQQRFVELFGDVLIKLGYEADNSWAESPQNPTDSQ